MKGTTLLGLASAVLMAMLWVTAPWAGGATVTQNTSAQFAGGTFADTRDNGSGSNPAVKIARNIDLGTGADGAYVGGSPALDGQYTDVTIDSPCSPAAWNGSSGGVVRFKATGTVTINGVIDATGKGYRGGRCENPPGYAGESYAGCYNTYDCRQQSANYGGGGGGIHNGPSNYEGSGGGGGYGSAGQKGGEYPGANDGGYGGGTYGSPDLTLLYFGSGGGGGCGWQPMGGAGGGIVFITAQKVKVNTSILANGQNGYCVGNCPTAGGGGGSGGSIKLVAEDIDIGTDIVHAMGGIGNSGSVTRGGDGGVGRIRCEYATITGSSNPTYSAGTIPFKLTGTYTSSAIDLPGAVGLGTLSWVASGGTSMRFRTRTAASAEELSGATWSSWLTSSGSPITSTLNEYIQYQAELNGTTTDSPSLSLVSINYVEPTATPTITPTATITPTVTITPTFTATLPPVVTRTPTPQPGLSIPPVLNYQGRLLSASSQLPLSGAVDMEFALWDDPTSADPAHRLWREIQPQVPISAQGVYSALLGTATAFPPDLFSTHPMLYLGVKVGSDPEAQPRQLISSVGYALQAGHAAEASRVAAGAVNNENLAEGVVENENLADGAVTSRKAQLDSPSSGPGSANDLDQIGGVVPNTSLSIAVPTGAHYRVMFMVSGDWRMTGAGGGCTVTLRRNGNPLVAARTLVNNDQGIWSSFSFTAQEGGVGEGSYSYELYAQTDAAGRTVSVRECRLMALVLAD